MSDTARYLKVSLKRNDQTIVIMGSLIPLIGFSPSDAPFNLGFTIAKTLELSPGVYVCMQGRVLSSDEAIKIIPEGRFSSIFSSND